MCRFQIFNFRCGCAVLKVSQPCAQSSVNVQGQTFCPSDRYAYIDDGKTRQLDAPANGPGICDSMQCKWRWGILPPGMYEEDVAEMYGWKNTHHATESEFDMSSAAGKARERAWFELLTQDQKFEAFKMDFPVAEGGMSLYARAHFNQDAARGRDVVANRYYELKSVELRWYELNPRYLSSEQLQHATGLFLPASVTIPGDPEAYGSTPHMPMFGPFAVSKEHKCSKFPGICSVCGKNVGDSKMAEGHATNEHAHADKLHGPERTLLRKAPIRLDEPVVEVDIYGEDDDAMEGVEQT